MTRRHTVRHVLSVVGLFPVHAAPVGTPYKTTDIVQIAGR